MQMSSKARRGCLMLEDGGADRYEPPHVVTGNGTEAQYKTAEQSLQWSFNI